jgi:hypothetical protein
LLHEVVDSISERLLKWGRETTRRTVAEMRSGLRKFNVEERNVGQSRMQGATEDGVMERFYELCQRLGRMNTRRIGAGHR